MPNTLRKRQRLAVAQEEINRRRELLQWLEAPNPRELLEQTDDDLPHAPAADPYR